jgi:hypothetical protein
MLRLLLPEPAGVETWFDENEYEAPDTSPERLRLYAALVPLARPIE